MIALSPEPETIVLPSGEKPTEVTFLLCAFCFSALSSSVAARTTQEGRRADWRGAGWRHACARRGVRSEHPSPRP